MRHGSSATSSAKPGENPGDRSRSVSHSVTTRRKIKGSMHCMCAARLCSSVRVALVSSFRVETTASVKGLHAMTDSGSVQFIFDFLACYFISTNVHVQVPVTPAERLAVEMSTLGMGHIGNARQPSPPWNLNVHRFSPNLQLTIS